MVNNFISIFYFKGSRTRPPKLFQSASTEENSIDPQSDQQRQINKNPKQRLSGLFGLKNPQKNQLCDILNHYAKNGVPQTATATQLQPEYNDTFEFLESMKFNSWTEFVDCTTMSDIEVKIQSAVWELVTTEIDYIHTLQTVTEVSHLISIEKDVSPFEFYETIRWFFFLFSYKEKRFSFFVIEIQNSQRDLP